MFRGGTERRPQRVPQGFKPRYAVVQPESPSPHRRWAVSGARGRACACLPPPPITGISSMAAELSGKRIELLRELIPGLTRVAVLIHGANPFAKPLVDEVQASTKR